MLSDQMEDMLLSFLYERRAHQTQFFNGIGISQSFVDYCAPKGLVVNRAQDEAHFREAFWQLVAKGLAVPGGSGGAQIPHVSISDYGIRCIESGRIQAHDPRGFVASLQKKVSSLDPIVLMYVEEALSCFENMNYLAATAMIGGALEKTILNLTDEFSKKLSGADVAKYKKDVLSQWKIKKRLESFLLFVEKGGFKNNLDLATKEKLESVFPAIANIIRIIRNETGHPTGRIVDREEAEASLLLAKEGIIFSSSLITLL